MCVLVWYRPKRELEVSLCCGSTEEVLDVAETSKCVYTMVFATPAACGEAEQRELDELRAALAALDATNTNRDDTGEAGTHAEL